MRRDQYRIGIAPTKKGASATNAPQAITSDARVNGGFVSAIMPRTKTCQAAVARLGDCNQPVEGAYFCARHWRAWDWREAEMDRLKKLGWLPPGNVLNVGKQLDEYERLLTDEPK